MASNIGDDAAGDGAAGAGAAGDGAASDGAASDGAGGDGATCLATSLATGLATQRIPCRHTGHVFSMPFASDNTFNPVRLASFVSLLSASLSHSPIRSAHYPGLHSTPIC